MTEERVIAIRGAASVSPLGATVGEVREAYASLGSAIVMDPSLGVPVAKLCDREEEALAELRAEKRYKSLDRTSLMAILAARALGHTARGSLADTYVCIGSSRGATHTVEQSIATYLERGAVPVATSPITTLGNIASWVAQELAADGLAMSHSTTCSTALHSFGNAVAWLRSGMAARVIAGASEAALTPFTVAQMQSLTIYSTLGSDPYPCRPLEAREEARNTFVLGEGCALYLLESVARSQAAEAPVIESIAFALEPIRHHTDISFDGAGLRDSMRRAIDQLPAGTEIDAVILHAPGTVRGDEAELSAVRAVFGERMPLLLSNKWRFGHTFGAAGALSLEQALVLLGGEGTTAYPYEVRARGSAPRGPLRRVMINTAGFGGNVASMVVARP